MHPIFQNWKVFLIYLAAWVPMGAILGFLIAAAGHLTAAESAAVTIPVAVLLAFICLSPWYICRSLPLRVDRAAGLAGQHVLAAIIVAGGVLIVARFAAGAFSGVVPGLDQRFRSAVPVLTAMVTMIYLLSIALHY